MAALFFTPGVAEIHKLSTPKGRNIDKRHLSLSVSLKQPASYHFVNSSSTQKG